MKKYPRLKKEDWKNSKLSDTDRIRIVELRREGWTLGQLCKKYGISSSVAWVQTARVLQPEKYEAYMKKKREANNRRAKLRPKEVTNRYHRNSYRYHIEKKDFVEYHNGRVLKEMNKKYRFRCDKCLQFVGRDKATKMRLRKNQNMKWYCDDCIGLSTTHLLRYNKG